MKIFEPKLINILEQNMFLGEAINVSRFDYQKHKIFETLRERQLSFFWRPEEIKLTDDRKQFKELTPHEQHIFTSNLKYQTLLDSVQGRAPNQTFLEICSLPELENWIVTWSFSETIHSASYTYILQNVYANPSEVLDDIPVNPEIIKRALAVTEHYDKLKDLISKHRLGLLKDLKELKKQLYLTLVSVNVLEAIRFYVSFACSFAFTEGKKVMEGNSKIIKFIARDEALHLVGTQYMINLIQDNKDDKEMYEISKECKDDVIKIFLDAVEQEKEWAKYLFKDGSILGLNEAILVEYLEYLCDQRLNAIGFESIFKRKKNPLPWMMSWLNNNTTSGAPQEVEISSYLISQINQDEDDFSNTSL